MLRRILLPVLALALTACDAGAPVSHPDATMPTPTWAPAPSASPAGVTTPLPERPIGVAIGPAIATISEKAAVVLTEGARSPVAGPPRSIVSVPGGGFRVVAGAAVHNLPGGATWALPAPGGAIAVPRDADWTAVALPERGDVIILSATGEIRRTIATGGRPSALAADAGRIAVLDARESSITVFDAATGARQEALRAGDGAVAVTAAGRGRFAVIDARDGELLVFDTGPLILRQRYPVQGGAWAAAYDANRAVLWVTLTARNEVVGFDLRAGAPREIARHSTVRLPLALAVDPASGALAVAGSDGTGAQGLVQRISA